MTTQERIRKARAQMILAHRMQDWKRAKAMSWWLAKLRKGVIKKCEVCGRAVRRGARFCNEHVLGWRAAMRNLKVFRQSLGKRHRTAKAWVYRRGLLLPWRAPQYFSWLDQNTYNLSIVRMLHGPGK